ncbi:DUF3306 domain-containing protein [Falsiroseomonas sp.]|uniref:DUF3306 domain-containing protein n=1 Tax=Falsiroseomonas sp. TaxID=2870721 RepID=UPI0035696363
MTAEDAEGFLSRWSRRKRGAAEEPVLPPEQAEGAQPDGPDPLAAAHPPAERQVSRAACPIPNLPEIDLASLPAIDDLTAESDFSLFLRPGVPPLLRDAALRRMWSLDPAIRDYIGPVEYQWDFNAPGGLPLGFADALAGDVKELLAQAIGQRDEPVEAAPDPAPDTTEPVPPDLPLPEPPHVLAAADPPAVEAHPVPAPRRHGGALPV